MNNILQKRILELSYQNNLLREEIEKIKKNLNEEKVRMIGPDGEERWISDHDVHDAENDGYRQAGGSSYGRGGGYTPRPSRDLASENTRWHGANVAPLIQKHGLDVAHMDEHGVPHAQHADTARQHPNFGAYMKDLKAAHERGFEESKRKNRSGKGSRWHVDAFGKIRSMRG